MTKSNAPYSVLATFYDKLISGYPYEKVIRFVADTVSGKGIDLGTGSGKFAIALAEKGHSVVGVDSSSQMLEKARENAKVRGVNPVFVHSDIMKLEFTRVNFVTAMCDVFNYLSGYNDAKKLFSRIYDALKDGGDFIFDVSSAYKLKSMAGEQYFEDRDELTYLWCNSIKSNKLMMNIAYFIPMGEDTYSRVDETHEMFIYEAEKLTEILENIGFKVKIYGEKLTKYTNTSRRIFFFCKKA